MTDEEYVFRQTEVERKKLGYGDRHKKRGGGRYVRFSSDNLTKKEREARNGEVEVYEMNKPHTAEELRIWPERVRKEFISGLIEKYHPTLDMLGEMLGYKRPTVCTYLKRIGISTGRTGPNTGKDPDMEGWDFFINGEPEPFTQEETEGLQSEVPASGDVQNESETSEMHEERPAIKHDLHNIALLLQSLAGTGAKLTIEVTL